MKTIKIFFISVVLYAVGIGMAMGEEYTKALQGISGSNAIVRDIGNNQYLVYYNDAGQSCFSVINNGGSSTYALYTDIDSVYDMEIYGDEAYFCGRMSTLFGGSAVMGFFSLSTFPSTTIYYFNMPWFERAKKLEVAWMANRKHVVMTADAVNGMNALVDAIQQTGNWEINYTTCDTADVTCFEDIAVTENYVVATAYHNGTTTSWGRKQLRLMVIARPTINGSSLFPVNATLLHSSERIVSPFEITHCEGDYFVAAVRDAYTLGKIMPNFVINRWLDIYSYNGLSFVARRRIHYLNYEPNLKDVKYNSVNRTTDMLIHRVGDVDSTRTSEIYHLDQTLISGGGTATIHADTNTVITSLDRQISNANHFFAVGNTKDNYSYIRMFKYNQGLWDGCLLQESDTVITRKNDIKNKSAPLLKSSVLQVPQEMECSPKPMVINVMCNTKND